jgi:hypothetical protein
MRQRLCGLGAVDESAAGVGAITDMAAIILADDY